jgi:hypothetical protein
MKHKPSIKLAKDAKQWTFLQCNNGVHSLMLRLDADIGEDVIELS